jgi:hypothetical protein
MFNLIGWACPEHQEFGPNAWRIEAKNNGAFIGTAEQVTALGLKMEDCGSYVPKPEPPKIDPKVFNSKIGKEIQRLIHEDCDERETETVVVFEAWDDIGGFHVSVTCRSLRVIETMAEGVRSNPKPSFAYFNGFAIRANLDDIKIKSAETSHSLNFFVYASPDFRTQELHDYLAKIKDEDGIKDGVEVIISDVGPGKNFVVTAVFKMSPAKLITEIDGKPII